MRIDCLPIFSLLFALTESRERLSAWTVRLTWPTHWSHILYRTSRTLYSMRHIKPECHYCPHGGLFGS